MKVTKKIKKAQDGDTTKLKPKVPVWGRKAPEKKEPTAPWGPKPTEERKVTKFKAGGKAKKK